jgi:ADP-ribose pyrophosphatase
MTDPNPNSTRELLYDTPWVKLVAIHPSQGQGAPHYALESKDYVCIIALDELGHILLVKQFRPAAGIQTLEFPAGHVEDHQTPEQSARQELLDETGYIAQHMDLIACIRPDTGRLLNKHWCFFARGLSRSDKPIAQDEVARPLSMPLPDFYKLVLSGAFDHAQHLAPLGLAIMQGRLPSPTPPIQ